MELLFDCMQIMISIPVITTTDRCFPLFGFAFSCSLIIIILGLNNVFCVISGLADKVNKTPKQWLLPFIFDIYDIHFCINVFCIRVFDI